MLKRLIFTILLSLVMVPAIEAVTASTHGKKKTLIEGFHGEEDGWTPRMIAVEEHLAKKYGDDIVIVTYLGPGFTYMLPEKDTIAREWAASIKSVMAVPTTFFDRDEEILSKNPVISEWQPEFDRIEAARETDALDFSLTSTLGKDNQMHFNVKFSQEDIDTHKYQVTFLALIDVDEGWFKQVNFYEKYQFEEETIPEMERFINGYYTMEIAYPHVTVANSDFNGLPVNATTIDYSLTLPDLRDVRFSGYRGVAIITDNEGNYVNSLSVGPISSNISSIYLKEGNEFNAFVGDTHQFNAITLPNEYSEEDSIVWSSSNEDVAIIDESGMTSFVGEGTAVITASSSLHPEVSASCTVKVTPSPTNVTIPSRSLYRNTTVTLPLQLKNTFDILGMQCDIILPEGIEFVTDDSGHCNVTLNKDRLPEQTVTLNMKDPRHIRLLINSANNAVIESSEGDFLFIPLHILSGADATQALTVSDISLADLNSNSIHLSDYIAKFPIKDFTLGDLNGDDRIDIADVTAIISVIMGHPSPNIMPEASDFNADGTTDVSDVVTIIDHILSFPSAEKKNIGGKHTESSTGRRDSNTDGGILNFTTDTKFTRNAETEFKIRMSEHPMSVAAQFDIELPENFEFITKDSNPAISLYGEAADTHQLTASKINDNTARILIFSMNNSTFVSTDDFMTLAVKVSDMADDQESIRINHIKFVSDIREEATADYAIMNVYREGATGVSENTSEENINIDGHTIIVNNLNSGNPVELYTVSGMLAARAIPDNGTVMIHTSCGLYILKTATAAYKIAIK